MNCCYLHTIEINELNNLCGSSPCVKTKWATQVMDVPISPLCVKFNGHLMTILISPVAKEERLPSLIIGVCVCVCVCVHVYVCDCFIAQYGTKAVG